MDASHPAILAVRSEEIGAATRKRCRHGEGDAIDTLFALLRTALGNAARHPRTAVALGRLLGASFLVCFLTGLYSHLIQDPLPGEVFPTRPVDLYRVTQGVHVGLGLVCIPLLLGKLWTVYPLLFKWPPARSIAGVAERASIALFVGASLVQLAIGLLDTLQWYPFPFWFRQTHYALAWIIVGSLAIHIGVKLPIIARWWFRRRSIGPDGALLPVGDGEGELGHRAPARGMTGWVQRRLDASAPAPAVSRRTLAAAVGARVVAVVATTGGESVPALAPLDLFAPRRVGLGPQTLPVNKTAKSAAVVEKATAADWALTVASGDRSVRLSLAELRAMPQTDSRLPISCVEGWSTAADWRGVRFGDLAALVGAGGRDFTVQSLQVGAYATTMLEADFVDDPLTLVALEVNGDVLDLDHGYPARLIAPARPGVLQTKWLSRLEAR